MSDVLLEQMNPHDNLQAVVECDGSVTYLYLFSHPESGLGMKSVWVRNHLAAPAELDVVRMRSGLPPMNIAAHCKHPQGAMWFKPEDLSIVWLPEGNGVALFERGQALAVIPPWSGVNGFDGYA